MGLARAQAFQSRVEFCNSFLLQRGLGNARKIYG